MAGSREDVMSVVSVSDHRLASKVEDAKMAHRPEKAGILK